MPQSRFRVQVENCLTLDNPLSCFQWLCFCCFLLSLQAWSLRCGEGLTTADGSSLLGAWFAQVLCGRAEDEQTWVGTHTYLLPTAGLLGISLAGGGLPSPGASGPLTVCSVWHWGSVVIEAGIILPSIYGDRNQRNCHH